MSREAFEKWHLKIFGYEPTSEQTHNANKYFQDPVWMAWLDSESEQSKRIAELEVENVEFQKRITKDVFKIKKLQAQNAELMEALEYADKFGLFADEFISEQVFSKRHALKKLKQALAKVA